MTTQKYLSTIRLYGSKVEMALQEIARLEQLACSTSAPPMDREKVQSSRQGDRLGNSITKLIDIEREDYLNFAFKRKEIIGQIEKLDNPEREVLIRRYVYGNRNVDIAESMHMSERHISRLISNGLRCFESRFGHIYLHLSDVMLQEFEK